MATKNANLKTSSAPRAVALTPKKRGRKPGRTHTARIDFRLPATAREKIELAAYHSSQSLSDFAASTLLERAEAVLEKQRVSVLDAEQWQRFVQILTSPPPPTKAMQRLVRAGERHSWTDENSVTHTDARFFDALSDEDKLDPH